MDIFQNLVAARRQGYRDALEEGSDVTGQATRPLVRLQLDAKVGVLPIQQTIPGDVKMYLLLATARSDFQHMRQVARIGHILHFMYSAINALVGTFVNGCSRNAFL